MTADLKYLAWTALLTASLWIPYVICQVMTNGNLRAADYLDPTPRPLPLWRQRLNRVHQNSVEVFCSFCRAGAGGADHQQDRPHDGRLGRGVLLGAGGSCGRLRLRLAVRADRDLHHWLNRGRRSFLGSIRYK